MPITAAPGAASAPKSSGKAEKKPFIRGPPKPPKGEVRDCADCQYSLSSKKYSINQWSRGDGNSRCKACVGDQANESRQQQAQKRQEQAQEEQLVHEAALQKKPSSSAARANSALRAHFSDDALENPFASGTFRWVAQGEYIQGTRTGEPCVCKWFKTGSTFQESFFELDIKAVWKALEIIESFNEAKFIDKPVQLNEPEVWTFESDSSADWAGCKVLQEPFVQNYEKFNSNSGWKNANETNWHAVAQAISHYSYHLTGGQFLLCDLQGGVYDKGLVLTDPVIMSRKKGTYGVTDLGPNGIENFFHFHKCNSFCRDGWNKPHRPQQKYQPSAGTTMESITTLGSRPMFSITSASAANPFQVKLVTARPNRKRQGAAIKADDASSLPPEKRFRS